MKSIASGKLILSGEHAVVYQKPALTLAVDRHIQTGIAAQDNDVASFAMLGKQRQLTFTELQELKQRIDKQYRLFLNNECAVTDILAKPEELACYIIADVIDNASIVPHTGFKLHVRSNIPTGCGMGSSAALIVSVLLAAKEYFKLDLPHDRLLHRALFLENLQHGHSSGLDIRISMQGGCLYATGDTIVAKTPPKIPLYVVNTGEPRSSTGECCMSVSRFAKDNRLWDTFSDATFAIKSAFDANNIRALKDGVRENHRLLTYIGVVPNPIKAFITKIESQGAAAKICGAGTVRGDTAGMVLIATDDVKRIAAVCADNNFHIEKVTPQLKGAHIV